MIISKLDSEDMLRNLWDFNSDTRRAQFKTPINKLISMSPSGGYLAFGILLSFAAILELG